MSLNRAQIYGLLIFASLAIAGAAQDRAANNRDVISVSGPHARMSIVASPPRSFARPEINDSPLITIFSNLAARYPKGAYFSPLSFR